MAAKVEMDPPFFTGWEVAAFGAVLLFFLALPVLLAKSALVSRKGVYQAVPLRAGPYSHFEQQIFEEKSDIDILFLGSSLIWSAVDTPYVQKELSRKLGRDVNVLTFGSNWRGEDLSYVLLRDLLEKRKVQMLVIHMPLDYQTEETPHKQAFRWMLYTENEAALQGLSLRSQLTIYGEEVLGAPRHLLSLIRPDLRGKETSVSATLGANKVEQGFYGAPFVRRAPPVPNFPATDLIYSPKTKDRFYFTGQALNSYQLHFVRLIFDLARQHRVHLAILNIPISRDRHSSVAVERMFWPEVFGADVPIVGVPPATLFKEMSDAEIDQLFYDEHLNVNGSEYFTRAIAPAILELYAQSEQHTR